MRERELDELCINTIRMLAVDMVEKAKSGHPGLPMGAASYAYVLWQKFLRHNPANPRWFNRDRFVLSAGHGCALLYSLLHLTGYDLSLDELKNFRQWESKTPGHPEYGLTPGVEATTGPLGQGFGMAVGMAIAENFLAGCTNKPDFPIVDHYTYVIASDGDLMEGVSSEAASLAGKLNLGKLICFYDDNRVTIEGSTDLSFSEDVSRRFTAYGWQVIRIPDPNDLEAVEFFIRIARKKKKKPTLIIARTHIGYGSSKQDTAEAHGEPLGTDAAIAAKKFFNWPLEPQFYIPGEVSEHFRDALEQGRKYEEGWQNLLEKFEKKYPKQAKDFKRKISGKLPGDWDKDIPVFKPEEGSIATRAASGKIMNALARDIPNFLGGSADLAPSTKTLLSGYGDLGFDRYCPRNIHFGVREHAMGAIINGMTLHGGLIAYSATFLIFSDYMRPAIRLSALMNIPSIFIFTHDSIGLGEDGPTHQPIEHFISLRAIPNFTLIRPADANETAEAWRVILTRKKPTALILTRQNIPILDSGKYPIAEGASKGAYVIADSPDFEIIIISTGSEVHLALAVREELLKKDIRARVISMPSWEIFRQQPEEYRNKILPPDKRGRVSIEASSWLGWREWVGDEGLIIGIDKFGSSAPGAAVMERYGFNVGAAVEKILAWRICHCER